MCEPSSVRYDIWPGSLPRHICQYGSMSRRRVGQGQPSWTRLLLLAQLTHRRRMYIYVSGHKIMEHGRLRHVRELVDDLKPKSPGIRKTRTRKRDVAERHGQFGATSTSTQDVLYTVMSVK
uniref:Uncharacterized protein n=1 Tax=Daphnia magna TaxID=35525 RepID=A0A0P5UQP7_9CRUS